MTTGERIKFLRTKLGLSQSELAAKIGVKTPAIYKYENGLVVNLKRSTIERLANVLETTPSNLMGFEEEEKPTTVTDDELSPDTIKLLKSLSKDDLDIVLSVARQMKKKENESAE